MPSPLDVQLIGSEVAIRWDDGQESYITFATLRGIGLIGEPAHRRSAPPSATR